MTYETIEDIPDTLREALPEEAQKLYLDAYQGAWEGYDEKMGGEMDRDSVAHRQGMYAVHQEYVQHDDGKWYPNDEVPDEEEEEGSFLESAQDYVKDIGES